MAFRMQGRQTDRRGCQGESGCGECNRIAGEIRAGRGSPKAGLARLRCADHTARHSAVMYTVTAAADGQARVVRSRQGRHQRPQAKEQKQENGERPPHLRLMLHEIGSMGERRE
jgi:hypothetical protein